MPGVSLYGREEYSFGPYSENPRVYFEGKLTISAALSGQFNVIRGASGVLETGVTMSGQPEVVFGFMGYMRIDAGFSGKAQVHRNSKGVLPVSVIMSGTATIVHIKHMAGTMRINTRMTGKPSMLYAFEAGFSVNAKFKGDPYVGPFWADDKPHSPHWGPIPDDKTLWADDEAKDAYWLPVPKDKTVWKDDVPVDAYWRRI